MTAFLEQLADILEVAPGELSWGTDLRGLDTWDSLAHVSVVAMAEVEYQRKLSAQRLAACRTVEDLYKLIAEPNGS